MSYDDTLQERWLQCPGGCQKSPSCDGGTARDHMAGVGVGRRHAVSWSSHPHTAHPCAAATTTCQPSLLLRHGCCCRYEGLIKDGKMHSHGVLTFPNKDRCVWRRPPSTSPASPPPRPRQAVPHDASLPVAVDGLLPAAGMKASLKMARCMALARMCGTTAREYRTRLGGCFGSCPHLHVSFREPLGKYS